MEEMEREPETAETGRWKKAFTIEKERAEEYVELYESMGYDVKVVDASSCGSECNVCYLAGGYVEIWIREKGEGIEDEDSAHNSAQNDENGT